MQIDDALIDKLSSLCKLSFPDDERAGIKTDLQRVVDFVEKIAELDTSNTQPLIHLTPVHNVWRADEVHQTLTHEQALANAPKRDSDYIRVPKMIKGEQTD